MNTEKRYVADCREFPTEINCSLAITGREEEVLKASMDHAVSVHKHERSPELREQLRGMLREATS